MASCAKDGGGDGAPARKSGKVVALTEGEGAAALEDRFAFSKSDIKRDEQGNLVGGKRSQYEGRESVAFGGGVGTASYQGNEAFRARQWSGNREAGRGSYSGDTDGSRFQRSSRFRGTSASQLAQRSRFEGAPARTSTYQAGNAREDAGKPLDRPGNAYTDYRRRVFSQPQIMGREDYERMTVEQTRSILGRDE